jgi:hypothetical protein
MRRREFISTAAWPLAARAQQPAKLTSIGQASALRAVTTVRCLRFAGTVVVALAISLMLMAAPAFAQIKWTLPSAYPADNFHSQNLEAFAKDLAEATGGKLSIKVYPNASLLPVSVIKRTWLVHGAKASDREMRLCGTRLSRVQPTATPLLSFCDMACSFSLAPLASFSRWWGWSTADHPIRGISGSGGIERP